MKITDLSASQLSQAASLKEQIEKLQGELTIILGTSTPAATQATPAQPAPRKKFTMSASAKAAISKAAKARWAKIKAAQKK